MRRLVALAAFFAAVVTTLIGLQLIQSDQYNHPLKTDASFTVTANETTTSKADLIAELQSISEADDTLIIKPNTTADSYDDARDIYYFGVIPPTKTSPFINESGGISWMLKQRHGQLRSATDIGNVPLSGTYYLEHTPSAEKDLQQWALQNHIALSYAQPAPPIKKFLKPIVDSGLFVAYGAAYLLVITIILSWIFQRHRARAIQLLGGVAPAGLHFQAFSATFGATVVGIVFGALISLCVVGWIYGLNNVPLALQSIGPLLLAGLVITALTSLALSALLRPTVKHLALRALPVKQHAWTNHIVRTFAVILAMLTLPSAINLGLAAWRNYENAGSLRQFGNAVSLSIKDGSFLDQNSGKEEFRRVLREPAVASSVALSYQLDSSLEINPETRGEFDEFTIVNQHYLDLINVTPAELAEVAPTSLPAATQEFLDDQLELFLENKSPIDNAFSFYTYKGQDKFISFPQNTIFNGRVSTTSHPLIILARDPINTLKASGFLGPALTTGNLFFSNPAAIHDAITDSTLFPYVRSFDSVADSSLTNAQEFWAEFVFYLVTALVVIAIVAMSSWQSAQVWALTHRKHIVVQRTAGLGGAVITATAFRHDLVFTLAATFVGLILGFVFPHYGGLLDILMAAPLVAIIYIAIAQLSYRRSYKREFTRALARRAMA